MARRSSYPAVVAVVLSLLMHALGLDLTFSEDRPPSTEDGASDPADVGSKFEEFAEIMTETAEPEPASAPDPPSVTSPEQVVEETPTSRALVASDDPRDVTAPDTGTADVIEPDAAEPSKPDGPGPETGERSGGDDESMADVAALKPVEPDKVVVAPEGAADENPDPNEPQTGEEAPMSSAETISPDAPAPEPSPSAATIPEVQQPVLPETTVAPEPDEPESLTAEESEDGSSPAVTSSLRPPKERPSVGVSDVTDGARTGSSAGVIESPLTAYKRTGIDPFDSGSGGGGGGGSSGTTGFSGSRNPGNASTTNYIGRVLVQLNRSPVVYPSAKGTARVSFAIDPDGTVAWVSILGSRGSHDIERAAAAQIRNAAPFPPPPQGASRRLVFLYRNR